MVSGHNGNCLIDQSQKVDSNFYGFQSRKNLTKLKIDISCAKHNYIVGIRQLYPNTLTKFQMILWYIDNNAIGCFSNRIHDTLNPT